LVTWADRLPKQLFFGELLKKRPFHGAKKRWRDEVMSDLWAISVEDWYVVSQDSEMWSSLCAVAVDEVVQCREQYGKANLYNSAIEMLTNIK